ncbi:hypothetical protein [Bradyrhizobium sp. NBAIM01]|uniref:hypothetical protein n=1 Tax=Bradyrhizobium sp. NBAIM01 TaxID=2793818 RepID=UPI001CD257FE|nr:hypothetical protein [Bradyrhizobium sp. NBAIM01]MCA1510339.1 hypothetical protein [Bradyrhizobium sp. NBAIM01]
MAVENEAEPLSQTELTIVERYKRVAREDMDGPELLRLLKELEDEIKCRGGCDL